MKPHPSDFNDVKIYKSIPELKCCNGKHKNNINYDKIIQSALKSQKKKNGYPDARDRKNFMKF